MSLSVVVVVNVAATAAAFTQRRAAVGGGRSSSHVAAVGGEIDVILVIPITVDGVRGARGWPLDQGRRSWNRRPSTTVIRCADRPPSVHRLYSLLGGLGKLRATFLQRSLYSGRPSLPLQREGCRYRRQTVTFDEPLLQGSVSLVLHSWSPPSYALTRARLVALQLRRGG